MMALISRISETLKKLMVRKRNIIRWSQAFCLMVPIILSGCSTNCRYTPEGLRKLSHSEIIQLFNAKKQVSIDLVIKNRCGEIASEAELAKLNNGLLAKDQYVNERGEIVEFVLRERTIYDNLLDALENQAFNELEPFEYIQIDCAQIEEELLKLHFSDQSKRLKSLKGQEGQTLSAGMDRAILLNLFQQCGFIDKSLSDKAKEAAFLVIQHSHTKTIAHYYPQFLELAQDGGLDWQYIALMEDRILVYSGYPQLYGTQLQSSEPPVNRSSLVPIIDSINVDKRRKKMGLGPLDDYLASF